MDEVAERLSGIQERVALAARRVGRQPEDITVVAVSKKQTALAIRSAFDAGMRDFGENYVQEALEKIGELPDLAAAAVNWHLIGHLQRNKVKDVVGKFSLIQSVDSVRLAQAIDRQAALIGLKQPVLLQVHLGQEETKSGLPPGETMQAVHDVARLEHVELKGLMGIAPFDEDPRPHFSMLARLFDDLPVAERQVLSIGMSGDFEAAIEAGATLVRIGTAIFGARQ